VREILLHAKAAGKTVFLSSHLLSEIELVCDRIGILHRGRLVKLGTTAELLEADSEFEVTARGVSPEGFSAPDIRARVANVNDGVVTFRVPVHTQREAIERVWTAGGELLSVSPVRRTLEQVFLEHTASEPAHADSEKNQA
jgi:ABC-2 type transport system ATP-binding protein